MVILIDARCTGNPGLLDMGNVLTIQEGIDEGTLVSNNAVLCFTVPVAWSTRNQSYLEYNLAQV